MKIVYRIGEQGYMNAHDLFAANERPLYRRFSRRLMPWVGTFLLITQVLFLIVMPHRDTGLVVIGFMVGFFLVYCGFALSRYFLRSYQKDHRFKHDFTAEISDEGVHIVTLFSDSKMQWGRFVRFLESDEIFMVFLAQWLFLIFPKRAFVPGDADQLRMLLQRNVASPG
jgi:YcxB-like protein